MDFNSFPEDVKAWVSREALDGASIEEITNKLVANGPQKEIRAAIQQYFKENLNSNEIGSTSKTDQTLGYKIIRQPVDRKISVLARNISPYVVFVDNLLSSEECDKIVELSKQRLEPSTVVDLINGGSVSHQGRTSSGASFRRKENELLARIESRLSHVFNYEENKGEPIQVLNYAVGAEYRPHWDFFHPRHKGSADALSMGGQRWGTAIMYLNNVDSGGATVFPRLGLDFFPRKGSCLFFVYSDANGNLDLSSLHGGAPVEEGEKWIATKWLRINEYTGPMG